MGCITVHRLFRFEIGRSSFAGSSPEYCTSLSFSMHSATLFRVGRIGYTIEHLGDTTDVLKNASRMDSPGGLSSTFQCLSKRQSISMEADDPGSPVVYFRRLRKSGQ